jgi:hypothetical protein
MAESERIAVVETKLGAIDEKVDTLSHVILGNGDPTKGMVVKIDRLIQAQEAHATRSDKREKWIMGIGSALVIVLLTNVGKTLWYSYNRMEEDQRVSASISTPQNPASISLGTSSINGSTTLPSEQSAGAGTFMLPLKATDGFTSLTYTTDSGLTVPLMLQSPTR